MPPTADSSAIVIAVITAMPEAPASITPPALLGGYAAYPQHGYSYGLRDLPYEIKATYPAFRMGGSFEDCPEHEVVGSLAFRVDGSDFVSVRTGRSACQAYKTTDIGGHRALSRQVALHRRQRALPRRRGR